LGRYLREFLAASIAAREAEQAEEERRRAADLDLARKLQEAAEFRAEMERQAKTAADKKRIVAEKTTAKWQAGSGGAVLVLIVNLFLQLKTCGDNERKSAAYGRLTSLGTVEQVIGNRPFYFRSLAFSSDGKRLAVGGDDGQVHIVSLETGTEEITLVARPEYAGWESAISSVEYAASAMLRSTMSVANLLPFGMQA
jgi:hypothetical protein